MYNRDSKVHEQSERHVFVGLAPDQPAYRCINPVNGAVTVSPHVRFVESSQPGLVRDGTVDKIVPEFARDFDPLTPNAPDAFTLPITELGDEMVGGDGADTTELHEEQRPCTANPIAGPAQA